MISNYLKIAWRNLLKNKGLFFINTAGLAIGIAACILILLFISDELSYDRFNKKADRIVRVVLRGQVKDESIKEAVTPSPVAPTIAMEFPEVEQGTRFRNYGAPKASYGNKTFRNSRLGFADANFFQVFTLPMTEGDAATALAKPNTIVITENTAAKYFGNEDPMGKIINFDDLGLNMEVTGIIEDVPNNSHFHFDMFASMKTLKDPNANSWLASQYHNYLLLKEGADYKTIEAKLPQITEKYMGAQMKEAMGMTYSEFADLGNKIGLFLQPLTDIHLYSDFSDTTELEQPGNIKTIYIFAAIGLFILLIACINFINLTTAAASRRAREIGVKKIFGSRKRQLINQFLTESFFVTLISVMLGLIIAIVCIPLFNSLSGKDLHFSDILQPTVFVAIVLFVIFTALMAGSYPAFFLSSFQPVKVLKNQYTAGKGGKGIRSGLVVFQFIISACMILATITVDRQMSYIENKNVGYDKDVILVLRNSYLLGDKEKALREKLLQDSRALSITRSGYVPAGPSNNSMTSISPENNPDNFRRTVTYNVDEQYIPTLGITLLDGRNFSHEFGDEASKIIVNETFTRTFGFGKDAVGQTITIPVDNKGGRKTLTIIGVIKDFNFRSLHLQVEPMAMLYNPNPGLIIRAKTRDMSGLISAIKEQWESLKTEEPFSYALLDELYRETYLADRKMSAILRIFALLTIFVACLGLFALVTYATEQRFKEIGIRKVLGSSVPEIVSLLSRDFIKLVMISFVVAFPLGFYLMNKWLQGFAYRIEIQWWIFALAGTVTLCIAFLTISFKSIRSALSNPVDSIRVE